MLIHCNKLSRDMKSTGQLVQNSVLYLIVCHNHYLNGYHSKRPCQGNDLFPTYSVNSILMDVEEYGPEHNKPTAIKGID